METPIVPKSDDGKSSDTMGTVAHLHLQPVSPSMPPPSAPLGCSSHEEDFKLARGEIPFQKPNVRDEHEMEDLHQAINGDSVLAEGCSWWNWACLLTGLGCLCLPCGLRLVPPGEIGFVRQNGRVFVLFPGMMHFFFPPYPPVLKPI